MHADTCTNAYMHTHRDTDACMDGCTHNYYKLILFRYIFAVDKLLLKDDC